MNRMGGTKRPRGEHAIAKVATEPQRRVAGASGSDQEIGEGGPMNQFIFFFTE